MIKNGLLSIILIFSICQAVTAMKSWQYYYKKGVIEYNVQMYDFAIENLERVLELNPKKYGAANIMADIYFMRNDKYKAMKYWGISLKINDRQPDIHYRVGKLQEYYCQYEISFSHFKKAIKADPLFRLGHYYLTRHYIRTKDYKNAKKHFNICYKLGKLMSEKIFTNAILVESEDDDKAIDLYKSALDENPVFTEAYFRLSEIYRRKNDIDNAISNLEKITEIQHDNERAYIYLGHLYYNKASSSHPVNKKDIYKRLYLLKKALDNFDGAIGLNPANKNLNLYVSDIYSKLGQEELSLIFQKESMKLE